LSNDFGIAVMQPLSLGTVLVSFNMGVFWNFIW